MSDISKVLQGVQIMMLTNRERDISEYVTLLLLDNRVYEAQYESS